MLHRGHNWEVHVGNVMDVLTTLEAGSVHCCVSSSPYWGLRDYGVEGQLGLEKTPEEFVENMVNVYREVWRVLRKDGTCWVNLGDSYANDTKWGGRSGGKNYTSAAGGCVGQKAKRKTGLKPKELAGIPWRFAFAMSQAGWYLRSEIIWCKTSPMPESVRDRPTNATEKIFLFTKQPKYFYDQDAERIPQSSVPHSNGSTKGNAPGVDRGGNGWLDEKYASKVYDYHPSGRNLWNYWTDIRNCPYPEAHFATFPPDLPARCVRLGTSAKGCCAECGAPWVRIVEKTKGVPANHNGSRFFAGKTGETQHRCGQGERTATVATTGWQPSCTCNAEVVPCTVLDPFSGSGTTGEVATELGRKYIGIELNTNYAEMSRKRIESWKHRDAPKPAQPMPGQKDLFEAMT